jgi:hypothetical protein
MFQKESKIEMMERVCGGRLVLKRFGDKTDGSYKEATAAHLKFLVVRKEGLRHVIPSLGPGVEEDNQELEETDIL